ncbi:hypothetical protein AAFF_G00115830 [Aldrovandia affinis]|uniref:Uncharacterized protein n=1 Tax=Aldrovandia affinis TaxID=143900 RepID=A0AAD7WXA8_9TELE|nr:hypothetical protein AAFF_G00115830 [Aldrovandia affinis]
MGNTALCLHFCAPAYGACSPPHSSWRVAGSHQMANYHKQDTGSHAEPSQRTLLLLPRKWATSGMKEPCSGGLQSDSVVQRQMASGPTGSAAGGSAVSAAGPGWAL